MGYSETVQRYIPLPIFKIIGTLVVSVTFFWFI